jgi:hypothetical protein
MFNIEITFLITGAYKPRDTEIETINFYAQCYAYETKLFIRQSDICTYNL